MDFWQDTKNACSKHLGVLLAGTLIIFAIAVMYSSKWYPDYDDFLLNLGTEVIGIAITIGVIDKLLEWRNTRERNLSVKPNAQYLLIAFQSLRDAYDQYLPEYSTPPPDVIERYRSVLKRTITSAAQLVDIVYEHQHELAGNLAKFVIDAETHLTDVENVTDVVRYAAPNATDHLERVRADGHRLLELSDEVSTQVATIYGVNINLFGRIDNEFLRSLSRN